MKIIPQEGLKKKTAIVADSDERVMGFEPTNGSLGSYCLTTWPHPRNRVLFYHGNLGVMI